ncbi:WXG100 family type VII secretion target [Kibdelosporangium philippinense]|uniref:WXG100 family type VII secretion target n=1 Tax=Kibdelosporangium philippinense TaxID=211113 RepID=A0ABS8ZE24_9PSEU|nr:WXG100 family type VII secretion target [Kibdelosporangium philippinense]MCE7005792.1 WXG100 family type VII secretion target [Kibdelosporangium philippinense]
MTSDDITAPLKPVNAKDIDSTTELLETFKWFKDNLSTRTGRFGELYQCWNGHPASKNGARGWAARPWNGEDDRMVDDLGGIDFGPMLGDIERFGNLRASSDEMRGTADSIRNRLTDAWSGPAAETAVEKLDQLGKASTKFRDTLNQFAAALDGARTTTKEAITELKTAVGSQVKTFTLSEGVDLRRQQVDRLDVAVAGGPPFGRPIPIEELTRPSTVDLNEGGVGGHWWSNETINALDAMCDSYFNAISALRKLIGETTTAIANSWTALNEALKRIQATTDLDPFGKITGSAPAKPSPHIGIHSQSADRVGVTVDGKRYEMDFGSKPEQPSAPPQPVNPATGAGSGGGGGGGASEGAGSGGGGGGSAGSGSSPQPPLPPGSMAGIQAPAAHDGTPDARPAGPPAGAPAGGPPAGAPMGGMPMGAMGGGGGQGGDQERQSKWRTQGDLFDDAVELAVPMVIGDDDPYGAFGPKGKQ